MKKIISTLIIIIAIISFNSCDKIDTPIPEGIEIIQEGLTWDDSSYVKSSSTLRKVLIEEYTGHYCTNCPEGAAEIQRLVDVYGDQIIPISLHSGDVTFNEPHTGSGSYETDFRTEEGEEYATLFPPNGLPKGMVSRKNAGEGFQINQWENEFLTIKNDVPIVSIELSTLYNDSARIVKTLVNTNWLTSSTGSYKLQIQLVEDSIVDWQLNNGVNVPDYLHRHVFRGSINGVWGSAIPSANQGDSDTQEFTYTIPDNFKKKDCIVVVFVYKDNPSFEIVQVEELHVTTH